MSFCRYGGYGEMAQKVIEGDLSHVTSYAREIEILSALWSLSCELICTIPDGLLRGRKVFMNLTIFSANQPAIGPTVIF